MSDMMQARTVMTKKMNVMVRKIDGVASFVLTGNDEYSPDEIFFVVAVDHSAQEKVYADLNFLIREFLNPIDIQKNESEGRLLSNYVFDNGLKAQVIICGEDNLPEFEWWVPYLDRNRAVLDFYPPSSRKRSDPTAERPQPDNNHIDEPEDSLAPDRETATPEPIILPAVDEIQAEHESEPQQATVPATQPAPPETDLWHYFYDKVNIAKHAIAGGSLIYAGEIIGELRTLLIKLICESEGVTDDYLHSIDLLPESHRSALVKTYPTGLDNARMISALAAEHSLFEQLMEKSGC